MRPNTARWRFTATALMMVLSCAGTAAITGCGPSPATRTAATAGPAGHPQDEGLPPNPDPPPRPAPPRPRLSPFKKRLLRAERNAPPAARAVLASARKMINDGVLVIGSCWGYINEVFNRAGFKHWRTRKTVFSGRKKGPYANPDLVKAGDWLYIVRYPKILGTHSVLFVFWVDKKRREAAVVTYVGTRREESAWYRTYDVSRIYRIKRPRFRKPPVKAPR